MPHDALTHSELLTLQRHREGLSRRQAALDHQIITRLSAEADPQALGVRRWPMCWPFGCGSPRAKHVDGSSMRSAADVRSILAADTGTPQPRTAGDALVLDLPTASTRSLVAYKITSSTDVTAS